MKAIPLIGITLGEPKGIGPEVVMKALKIREIYQLCVPVVFGSYETIKDAARKFGFGNEIKRVSPDELKDIPHDGRFLSVIDGENDDGESILKGLKDCAELCMEDILQGMVTGPLDKHRIHKSLKGKKKFSGHTQFLKEVTGAERVAMMLQGEQMRVVPVTTHCALREVSELLSIRKIVDAVELTTFYLKESCQIGEPRIAVSALNPHAGEEGLFGSEETKIILPAVEKCRLNGMYVNGPTPADTLFHHVVTSRDFDAVITMYHDQALIPLKMLYFHSAINITLGLPIVRTAVDHGTAYDIVGKNVANPSSMVEAIRTASHLCRTRVEPN